MKTLMLAAALLATTPAMADNNTAVSVIVQAPAVPDYSELWREESYSARPQVTTVAPRKLRPGERDGLYCIAGCDNADR